MRYTINFNRLKKVHWVNCNSKDTAQIIFDALVITNATDITVIESDGYTSRTVHFQEA